jgi:geranylgeranyl pyrophosphate synthase
VEVGQGFEVEDNLLLDIAVFTELLHNASLIHDDLIDGDTQRRGHPAVWSKYGKPKALLVGDLLIAKAFEIASLSSLDSLRKVEWVTALSKTVATAVRGAVHELDFTVENQSLVLEQYHTIAADKTGVLFSLPVRCIGIASNLEDTAAHSLSQIFSNLAVAYQIKDDQADFLGFKVGREKSSDILNGRPNIYHLLASSEQPLEEIFTLISDYQNDLIVGSLQAAKALPKSVQTTLEKLLLPFVRLKPFSPTRAEIQMMG